MLIEEQLRERQKRVEALYFGATAAGDVRPRQSAEGQARGGVPPRSRRRDEVQLARPMVGPIVHRLLPALWHWAIPISAAALDDDHGQGATPLLRHRGVAAVF